MAPEVCETRHHAAFSVDMFLCNGWSPGTVLARKKLLGDVSPGVWNEHLLDTRARYGNGNGNGNGKLQLPRAAGNRLSELSSCSQCEEREKGIIEIGVCR